jgi:hypothetical protein
MARRIDELQGYLALTLCYFFGSNQLVFQRDTLEKLGTNQITSQNGSCDKEGDARFSFGQILPLLILAGVILNTRQTFQSGRPKYNPSAEIETPLSMTKEPRQSTMTTTLVPASESTSRVEQLLRRDIYMDRVWLFPAALNIGAVIFLFFQLIASSGNGTACALVISMAYSIFIACVSCGTTILAGLVASDLHYGGCMVWMIALQTLVAIVWLSQTVMAHNVSFDDNHQMLTMAVRLLLFLAYCWNSTE